MTTEQYWQLLDALASSKGTDRLWEAVELLRAHPRLPLLISCHRAGGRIRHLLTFFDARNPDAAGNRYLICSTSERQAKKAPVSPSANEAHEARPDFSNIDERYGKRRKKNSVAAWTTQSVRPPASPQGKSLPS